MIGTYKHLFFPSKDSISDSMVKKTLEEGEQWWKQATQWNHSFVPTIAGGAGFSQGTTGAHSWCSFIQLNKTVLCQMNIQFGTGAAIGAASSDYTITLPLPVSYLNSAQNTTTATDRMIGNWSAIVGGNIHTNPTYSGPCIASLSSTPSSLTTFKMLGISYSVSAGAIVLIPIVVGVSSTGTALPFTWASGSRLNINLQYETV